jgi:putative flippase GtrA
MSYIVNNWQRHRSTLEQFFRFGVTGAAGAVVDFGAYTFLTRVVDWKTVYMVAGFEVIAANMVSVFLAIVSNFLLNRYWTFNDTQTSIMKQWTSYFGLNSVTWVLNQVLTSVFAFQVPILAVIFGPRKDFVAKALAIGCIMFVNFLGSKFLIFRKSEPTITLET